ncbi:MAG: hypothetical protein ACI36Z_02650 [Alloprevotella sp.]
MKQLYLFFALLLAPFNASSQQPVNVSSEAPMRAAEEGFIWWNYNVDDSGQGLTLSFPKLTEYSDVFKPYTGQRKYNLCSIIPGKFAGCTISKVKIALAPPKVKYADDYIRVWLSPVNIETDAQGNDTYIIPESSTEAENVTKYATARTNGVYFQFYTITLKTPYTVPKGGCYIGYEFEVGNDEDAFFLWGDSEEGGCYMQFEETDGTRTWRNMTPYGLGNLTTSVYMELSDQIVTDASVKAQDERNYRTGEEFTYAWTVTNLSSIPFSTMELAISVDGQTDNAETIDLGGQLPIDGSCTITRPMRFEEAGEHTLALEILRVDGRENESTHRKAEGKVIVINPDKLYPALPVVEEFTSTSCQWCPRGTVGLAKLKEIYGEDIVTLAGHSSLSKPDPMTCKAYAEVMAVYGQSLPSAAFNRIAIADPYLGDSGMDGDGTSHFAADRFVEKLRDLYPSEGKVEMTAEWADAERQAIRVQTASTFCISRTQSPYRLAFVLSEDGLSGQTSSGALWAQYNGYSYEQGDKSGQYPDGDLDFWINASSVVNTTYNHVVVDAWEPMRGIEGSIPSPITADESVAYETTLDISGNSIIQDKDRLTLVVLLLNDNNGFVINAAQCAIGDFDPSAVRTVVTDHIPAPDCYNLQGIRQTQPSKGLYIQQGQDGKFRKILVH